MTLSDLIGLAHDKTKLPMPQILAIVQLAWPNRDEFTPTQARLVIAHIRRKKEQLCGQGN